uniref:ATP synthase F0 subunit 8 n=1 Tax=Negombata magnifica TaxID=344322 RepID=A9DFT2_NEGMA|nr:ATP synthase F0 subunit 8 [Negombata magnifica]CAM06599.1 ATP synthase F0 subunit 8 [Negombata magnifica]
MPQLDIVSYLTQYIWVLLALLVLFVLIVLRILPIIQQQLVLRAWAERGFKGDISENLEKDSGSTIILRSLLNLKC